MAADAYIRSAITQLQSALTDLQQQMHTLQNETNQRKQDHQQQITTLEQERKLHEAGLNNTDDDSQKHLFIERIDHINKQCDEHRASMSQLDQELSSLLQRKTQAFNNLKNLSGQLDLFMASPDIR